MAAGGESPRVPGREIPHLAERLPGIQVPALRLWGDADPISPVRVGQRLASLLPRAELHGFPGGDHDLASGFARDVGPLTDRHLLVKP